MGSLESIRVGDVLFEEINGCLKSVKVLKVLQNEILVENHLSDEKNVRKISKWSTIID